MKPGDRVEVRFNSHFYPGQVAEVSKRGTQARVVYYTNNGARRDRWLKVYPSLAELKAAPGGGCANL